MKIDLALKREQRGDRAIRFQAMTLLGVACCSIPASDRVDGGPQPASRRRVPAGQGVTF
jgi:hypothetical protein